MVFCAVPSLVGATMISILFPESPRFLATHEKQEEALDAINRLISTLNFDGPLLTLPELYHFFPVRCAIAEAKDPSCFSKVALAYSSFSQQAKWLYLQLLATMGPIQTIWMALNFGYYGISTWIYTLFVTIHLKNIYFTALLFTMANLPANILTVFLLDSLGRQNTLIVSALSASVSLFGFAYFASTDPLVSTGVVWLACIYQAFVTAAWNSVNTLTSERFPTVVRSTGLGLCSASGRIGALIAQLINGYLVSTPAALLVVASGSLVIVAAAPFFLPGKDMSNEPLADLVESDDNEIETVDEASKLLS